MLEAPFPYFGGKRRVAAEVWRRFGRVRNYVEPFFGSGAVLLGRLGDSFGTETVNDKDSMIANFWRSVKADPAGVARWADYPVIEADLEARHYWLVCQRERIRELMADPDAFDAKAAGWWVWGACAWIGSGWCDGRGPWNVEAGKWTKRDAGKGINRQLPHLGDAGRGINARGFAIESWLAALSERLRGVRVACGDWRRVLGDSVTVKHGTTAVFLDPPYTVGADLYSASDGCIFDDVWAWAIGNGDRADMRIALCGYDDGREAPPGWSVYAWKALGGYGSQGKDGSVNATLERIWFSPHCLGARQKGLFDDA